jgi:hypothetical protein
MDLQNKKNILGHTRRFFLFCTEMPRIKKYVFGVLTNRPLAVHPFHAGHNSQNKIDERRRFWIFLQFFFSYWPLGTKSVKNGLVWARIIFLFEIRKPLPSIHFLLGIIPNVFHHFHAILNVFLLHTENKSVRATLVSMTFCIQHSKNGNKFCVILARKQWTRNECCQHAISNYNCHHALWVPVDDDDDKMTKPQSIKDTEQRIQK